MPPRFYQMFQIADSPGHPGMPVWLGPPKYLKRIVAAELAVCDARDQLVPGLRFSNENWALLLLIAKENLSCRRCSAPELGQRRGLPTNLVARYLSLLANEGLVMECGLQAGYALTADAWKKLCKHLLPQPAND